MYQTKIKTIVFDLGNVLLPFDYSVVVKKLNSISEGCGDRFYNFHKENYSLHRTFEKGLISEDEFIFTMLKSIDFIIDADTFRQIYSDIFTVNDDVANLLPILKRNYKLVLLSNTNSIHKKYGYEWMEFFKYFDKLILSHEAGAVKPEDAIYKCVEDFTGDKPDEHIFIDDIPDYVHAALNRGWDGIVFKNYFQLKEELHKKNILID